MLQASSSSVSQTDRVLAITFLNNADLTEAVLRSAKLKLIFLATKKAYADLDRPQERSTISIELLEPEIASVGTTKEEFTALVNPGSSIRASRERFRAISSMQERFGNFPSTLRSTYDGVEPQRQP